MPYLNLKLCGEPSQETATLAAKCLTALTAEILKKKRELTAIAVEFVAPLRWYTGGTSLADQSLRSFYLDIKVTEGTNTKDEKALYASRVFAGIEAIVGTLAPASYIVIHEVRADAWGYQGQTQEFRYVRGKAL
ncbi:MAG: tautomerase family protein [Burkholderiales bacterium]